MNWRVPRKVSRLRRGSRSERLERSLPAKVRASGSPSGVSKRSVMVVAPLILFGVLAFFSACSSAEVWKAPPVVSLESIEGPRMLFTREAVNLGKVAVGERVRYDFRFRNVGNATLLVSDVIVKVLDGC